MSRPGTADDLRTLAEIERYLLHDLAPMQATVMTGHGAGVRRAATLLADLGDPQEDLRVVHVAGTAGKGSVCAFLDAVLRAHGHATGRYLSPHAHTVLERFSLDGAPVAAPALGAVLADVRAAEQRRVDADGPASMFEVATVAAYELFRRAGVGYAVVETGLGGRHDATNVVRRTDKLAVLTAIGLDHTDVLGDTLTDIAGQKAGILPAGGRALAVRSGPEADAAVAGEAARRRTRLEQVGGAELAASLPDGLGLRLPGRHQRVNAGIALRAAETLARRDGWELRSELAVAALGSATLPGRFERRTLGGHPVVLDGAHNPLKTAALVDGVRQQLPDRLPVWVVAVKPDKDLDELLRSIAPRAQLVIATEFGPDEPVAAVAAEEVARAATGAGATRVEAWPQMADALARAVSAARDGAPVVVTGSFHAVAAAGRRTLPAQSGDLR